MNRSYTLSQIREAAFFAIGKLPANALPTCYAAYCELFNALDALPPEPKPAPEQPAEAETQVELLTVGAAATAASFTGYGSKIKRRAYERLAAYRDSGGSLRKIADASAGDLTTDELRRMLDAEKLPFAKWERLAAVLDQLEDPA
jgi:hypothetical protein